jgi:hypothetical protein
MLTDGLGMFNEKRQANSKPLGSTVIRSTTKDQTPNRVSRVFYSMLYIGIANMGRQEIFKAEGSHFSQGII